MSNHQLIPFPFPEYLAEFISSQLEGSIETMDNGDQAKSLHISRNSEFGKFIYRCLKRSNKPTFAKKGYTMYIRVSSFAGITDKNVEDGRYSFLDLDDREIKEIISVFKSWFKTCLVHYVDGAKFAHGFHGKQKGIVHAAILDFMCIYKISQSKSHFESFVKHYNRNKFSGKPPIERLI